MSTSSRHAKATKTRIDGSSTGLVHSRLNVRQRRNMHQLSVLNVHLTNVQQLARFRDEDLPFGVLLKSNSWVKACHDDEGRLDNAKSMS
jgi:hypothetical protein